MTLRQHQSKSQLPRRLAAFTLIECLVYIALLLVVTEFAYATFYRGWTFSLALKRNAEQVTRVMTTGERWRTDVRTATGPLRAETTPDSEILHIPLGGGEIQYKFAAGSLLRRTDERAPWTPLLNQVKSSFMQPDVRGEVTAWRWEVELKIREQNPKVRPLLTFLAVPARQPLRP